ncbi:MAG: hypothetical protein OXR66_07585 [Candidatus Woesearchaeota archaeon]|nr:hypothetical protein [Candidatus Woesearchaeota archaeon]
MNRKLVRQGVRALTVTVPSAWVKKNHLQAGDELNLSDMGNTLYLSTEKKQILQELTLDVRGLPKKLVTRSIGRAYQRGYDKIVVKFDTRETMMTVKDKVPELMGFELLNIKKNHLEIHAITSNIDLDFDVILRRAMLLLLDMTALCGEAWKDGDSVGLRSLEHQDIDVNKFTSFCLRHLNKSHKMMTFGSSSLYYLIENLEDLGDELKQLGIILQEVEVEKDTLHVLRDIHTFFQMSYDQFYNPQRENIAKLFEKRNEIKQRMLDILKKQNDSGIVRALLASRIVLRLIYSMNAMRFDAL